MEVLGSSQWGELSGRVVVGSGAEGEATKDSELQGGCCLGDDGVD